MPTPKLTHASQSSSFNMKQTIFLGMLCVLAAGFLLQFNIIRNLTDGYHHTASSAQNNNNNIITINIDSHDEPKTPSTMLRKAIRTRIKESDVLGELTQAYQPVDTLIQPPLGEGTSKDDKTLTAYNTDFRGIDMSLSEQTTLRSNRIVYLVSPTHKRRTQMVDLTRLSQTLRLAREGGYHERLYWIILEDADQPSHRVRQIAIASGVPFAHKAIKTPLAVKKQPKAHRGLEQRNAGLDIVEEIGAEGVVYFLDDDNAYHVQLFHELAYTTHVSVFGTGLPGGSAYERCRVDPETGKVDKLLTTWEAPRKFALDMAGFAFATHHLARATVAGKQMRFAQQSLPGFLESDLVSFAASSIPELEPLAANCTRILAWHVKTVGNDLYYNPEGNNEKFDLMVRLV